jgi:hypothetical protein
LVAAQQENAQLRAELDRVNAEGRRVVAALEEQKRTAAASAASAAAAAAVAKAKLKAPQMPQFKGEIGSAVDTWLRGVKKVLEFHGSAGFTDEAAKISYVSLFLEGTAAEWWERYPNRASTILSWQSFEEALYARFRPMQADHVARERLVKLQQRGRVSTYIDAFQSTLAPIKNMSEVDQIFHFRRGLDAHLQMEVMKKNPQTLHQAMDAAVLAEAYSTKNYVASASATRTYTIQGSSSTTPSTSAAYGSAAPMDINHINIDGMEESSSIDEQTTGTSSAASAASVTPVTQMLAVMQHMQHQMLMMQQQQRGGRFTGNRSSAQRVPGLKREDIEKLRKEGRCFYCQEKGHMKTDCPKMVKTHPKA